MRTLILIPIIHTEHDMGSLREQLRQAHVERYGLAKWEMHLESINALWSEIGLLIESLKLPFDRVRIYQDGLPECGREAEIIAEVAAQGSRNHRLLQELSRAGATVMGTEDPQLLLREYHLHQEALQPDTSGQAKQVLKQQSAQLLAERDRHIAARVNQTLQPGEIGLLFLGMSHSAHTHLEPDIIVRSLFPGGRLKEAV